MWMHVLDTARVELYFVGKAKITLSIKRMNSDDCRMALRPLVSRRALQPSSETFRFGGDGRPHTVQLLTLFTRSGSWGRGFISGCE